MMMKPPKFQICKEMIVKCKFQMALNHLKIDSLEIFLGVIDNEMHFKYIFGTFN